MLVKQPPLLRQIRTSDYNIAFQTDVIVDAYAINVENSYWKRASEFDPYRHLGRKDQVIKFHYLTQPQAELT